MKYALLVAFFCTQVWTIQAETAEEIIQSSSKKMHSYKTWSADYVQTMYAAGASMAINGKMQSKPPRQMRMEMQMPMMEQASTMTMIMGNDGILWQDMNMGKNRQVMKMDMNKVGPALAAKMGMGNPLEEMDPTKQWEKLQTTYALQVLPGAEIDGQPMHTLDATIKTSALTNQQIAAAAQMMGKMRLYVGDKDGFFHKIEVFDKNGSNVVMSQEFKNLKFNEDIADTTFTFQAPQGVPVIDMTETMLKLHNANPAPTPEQPPAEPPPSEK